MNASPVLFAIALVAAIAQAVWAARDPGATGAPILVALVFVVAGWAWGSARGTGRYRMAMILAGVGLVLLTFAILFVTTGGPTSRPSLSINDIALVAGLALEFVALVLAVSALATHRRQARVVGSQHQT
ncbi:MAG: hypothetical protein ABIR11_02025 [Candidatus Limnocylindrales bacterium]